MARKIFITITILGTMMMLFGLAKIYKTKIVEGIKLVEARSVVSKTVDEEDFHEDMNEGDLTGVLSMPKIGKELPILEGTETEELSKGVGHFTRTSMPGQGKQILLSGHRDTVFTNLGDLEIGDEIEVDLPYGSFTYVIEETKITDAMDTTIIDLDKEEEELVLSTCYPFNFIGSAPDRYIIYAYPKK